MNIILISQNATPGLLIFRRDLIRCLVASGHKLYCFASDFTESSRASVREMGATPIDYSLDRGGVNPFRDVIDVMLLSKLLIALKPDLVFSFFAKPVILSAFASRIARSPKCIGMLEGLGYAFTEGPAGMSWRAKLIQRVQIQLYKLAIPVLDKIVFLNKDDVGDLIVRHSIKAKKVEVLGGIGLNLEEYRYNKPTSEPGIVRFTFVGRLLVEKGIREFLEAAARVKKSYPNSEFLVLGAADKSNPGSISSSELNFFIEEGVISYPGYVENVADWVANSSVFVLPSYREGFPRSTQEAMAIGRAIITTDVPGCRDTVIDGVNGFLIPPWDVEALVEAMLRFIEDPDLIENMGRESYMWAQDKFDCNVVSQRLLDILELSE